MSIDPAHRSFVSYIDKSREFYAANGYANPYTWAYDAGTPPFAELPGPLSTLRVGLLTTTYPMPAPGERLAAKSPYAQAVEPGPDAMFTDDLFWDKHATHTRDTESFLPISRLQEQVAAGRIGSLSPRFYGVPTDYSQRRTNEQDAPAILSMMREDAVDVAFLVPL
jgi:hypothetical protein